MTRLRRGGTTCLAWLLGFPRGYASGAQGETTPGSEVSGGKCPKWSGLDEEAQKSLTVITVDSPKRVPNALSSLEGVFQEAFREASASLEDGVPAGGGLPTLLELRGRLYQI